VRVAGWSKWRIFVVAAGVVGAVLLLAMASGSVSFPWPFLLSNRDSPSPPPSFVGSGTCATCHQAEAARWDRSKHKRAMAHATDQSVLGDFDDATLTIRISSGSCKASATCRRGPNRNEPAQRPEDVCADDGSVSVSRGMK
jgi:hypothetical protein